MPFQKTNDRAWIKKRERRGGGGVYIPRGGPFVSGFGLTNSLKSTAAATAITSGITHFVQDDSVGSRTELILPSGLTTTGV